MKTTQEQMLDLLMKDTLNRLETDVQTKLSDTETSFIAKLDGLKTQLNGKLDEITQIIEGKPLQVTMGTIENPTKEIVHKEFLTVLNILKSQKRNPKNIMLVGEAGSGKTHLASCVANAFGLKFYPMSVGLQTTKSDLLGFINAHGQYVTSPIREAFEKGGVLLLDEFDSAHAGVVTIINSLLANGHCSFPDGIIQKNDNFICLVACNTYGHGANIDYVGRNRLDGATLDRFITVHVGYDSKLEEMLTCNNAWISIINKIRKNIEKNGIKMIVSPRASMNGADLLDAGFKIEDVIDMVILKGADKDIRAKILNDVDLSILEASKEISTVPVKKGLKIDYQRNLNKYQTFEIRTEYENFDGLISIEPVNSIFELDDTIKWNDYRLHFGRVWCHQYTSKEDIYFASKAYYKFTEFNKGVLKDFFETFEQSSEKNNFISEENGEGKIQCPVAFEFIRKGCRNPYKVIILGE